MQAFRLFQCRTMLFGQPDLLPLSRRGQAMPLDPITETGGPAA